MKTYTEMVLIDSAKKYRECFHCIINYDVGDNTEASKAIRDFVLSDKDDYGNRKEPNGIELSESCYLVRSNFDHHRLYAMFKSVLETENRFSVVAVNVFDPPESENLAYPIAPLGKELLRLLRLRGYLYLVDPQYCPKQN